MRKEYSAIPEEDIEREDYKGRTGKNNRIKEALHAYEERKEQEEADPLFDMEGAE